MCWRADFLGAKRYARFVRLLEHSREPSGAWMSAKIKNDYLLQWLYVQLSRRALEFAFYIRTRGYTSMSIMKNTCDLRAFFQKTLDEMQAGTISNTTARARLLLARGFIDTIKIEIAAASLGKRIDVVTFATNDVE